jgi:hypothetical protein
MNYAVYQLLIIALELAVVRIGLQYPAGIQWFNKKKNN